MIFIDKMSRVVRVAGRMVELSGLHGIWLGPDHLSRSRITLFYINNRPTEVINYECDGHIQAEKDKNFLEEAKKEFEKSLLTQDSLLKLH